jgi:hypothetical protein
MVERSGQGMNLIFEDAITSAKQLPTPEASPFQFKLTLHGVVQDPAFLAYLERVGQEMTRITQQQLESYLWGAAVLLRGTIDAGDYKQFIFPLLFYKRCAMSSTRRPPCTALRESGGDQETLPAGVFPGEPPLPGAGGRALAGDSEGQPGCGPGLAAGHAGHRDRQPRQALRHLRRCAVDQQGPPVRCHAARPHRALLHAGTHRRQPARGRAGPGLRVPDQEVRRRLRPHRRRVLHQPHRRPPHDRDARRAARRVRL